MKKVRMIAALVMLAITVISVNLTGFAAETETEVSTEAWESAETEVSTEAWESAETEVSTEARESAETEAGTETGESTKAEDAAETAGAAAVLYPSENDREDIEKVLEEGAAAHTDITQSNRDPVSKIDAYPNTFKIIKEGNYTENLIGVALTQVGYYRPEGMNTKYGEWYGYPNSAWCAMFISWCANEAKIDKDVIKPFCRCATEATWFKSRNKWKNPAGYTPVEGDIIFFHYNGSTINHVGVVTGTEGKYVYCIEGNNGDAVNVTRHLLTAEYISGYGRPDYDDETEETIENIPVYRLYNARSSEHFFTITENEKNVLSKAGWKYEGVAWYTLNKGNPVYRLYNPNTSDHFYTASESEKKAVEKAGWRYEGVAWYYEKSETSSPVYRLYNPNATTGTHHFTASVSEKDMLVKAGWKYEGVAWYCN